MYKKLFLLFLLIFFSCQKKKVTNHSIENTHMNDYNIILNNSYFIVDLGTGKMEDTKGRLLGYLHLTAEDIKFIKKIFFENSIYELTGDIQVFDNRKIQTIKNEDLLLIKKDNILIATIYIDRDYALKSKIDEEDVDIITLYKGIQKVLRKYKDYDQKLRLEIKNDDNVYL